MSDQENTTHVTGIPTNVSASGVNSWTIGTEPVEPKVPTKGVYTLEQGDSPGQVSIKLYGRSHRAVELFELNMDCAWEPGDVIDLPQ